MTQRWKLTIEYDGRPFCGWQRQAPGVLTVQGTIEAAIERFCQRPITLHAAGRTDSGVHARGQVAHFDLDYGDRVMTGFDMAKAINAHMRGLPAVILTAEPVGDDFHARFGATNKLYVFRLLNRTTPAGLDAGLVWHVRRALDVDAMRAAAQYLIGHHDFTTFRDTACQAKSPMRTVDRLDIDVHPDATGTGREITFSVEGRAFLHHQVRNMVGTLSLVGDGKWAVERVRDALAARDRTAGGPTAPPEGLYLTRIDY